MPYAINQTCPTRQEVWWANFLTGGERYKVQSILIELDLKAPFLLKGKANLRTTLIANSSSFKTFWRRFLDQLTDLKKDLEEHG